MSSHALAHDLPAGVVAAAGPPPPSDPVFIAIDEKISCVLNKDGGCENCEVQGTMSLQVRGNESSRAARYQWPGG